MVKCRTVWLGALLIIGCKSAHLPGETTAGEPLLAATIVNSAAPEAPTVREPWKVAVAEQRWPDAVRSFDAIYEHPTEPGLRYVRARIAAEVHDYERVVDLLNGLEPLYPAFDTEIRRLRATAQLEIGPFSDAAAFFQGQSGAEDRLRAVRAWQKARQPAEALASLERAKALFYGQGPSREAEWRALHADLLVEIGRGNQAEEDYVWIAVRAPTSSDAARAVKQLEQTSTRRLTKAERYQRLEALSRAGDLPASLAEEKALLTAPGELPSRVGVKRHLAWAHYQSRRDYLKAAALFEECSRADSSQVDSDLFYSARALSRAHQDQLAIVRYEELIRKMPSSRFAVTARQLIARLWYSQGEWVKAVQAYDRYLQKYGASKHHRAAIGQARQERAVALLALKDPKAVAALQELVANSEAGNHQALLNELLGVAYLQAGEAARAKQTFEAVIAERPLSFPALAAAARLREMKLPVPAELLPSLPEDNVNLGPLNVALPARVQQLIDLGLDTDAEGELALANGAVFDVYAPRAGEAACNTFGRLATAKERYRRGAKVIRERAVQRVIAPGTRWMWECLYPTPYATSVSDSGRRRGVEPAMIYAVMRQESAFQPSVESPAAAFGLMQIIEPTARSLAAELQVPYAKSTLLTPVYNIDWGAAYLSKLLTKFDGRLALAAGAYNAGPGALTRWLQTAQDLPLDLFVARIIYDETRTYVQRVVANWARYRYVEGGLANIPQLDLALPRYKPLAAGEY